MVSKARVAEADQASTTFHLALAQIGALATVDALAEWQSVPRSPGRVGGAWIDRLVRVILGRRRQSRELARSYVGLTRALYTGATIATSPQSSVSTTLGELREDFRAKAGAVLPAERIPPPPEDADDDADRILVERLAQLEREAEAADRAAEAELRSALEVLGSKNLDKKLDLIDDELPASQVDELRARAHAEAGARQAASASRIAQNGARGEVWSIHEKDRRAIGYVRLSRTGTPCGWCAMLISRGPVYRSENSAIYDDGDLYHDNCNCYAEPVYSREQYNSSSLFELNRKYSDLWPVVTRGLSGKTALKAWRRYFRDEQKARSARVAQSDTSRRRE